MTVSDITPEERSTATMTAVSPGPRGTGGTVFHQQDLSPDGPSNRATSHNHIASSGKLTDESLVTDQDSPSNVSNDLVSHSEPCSSGAAALTSDSLDEFGPNGKARDGTEPRAQSITPNLEDNRENVHEPGGTREVEIEHGYVDPDATLASNSIENRATPVSVQDATMPLRVSDIIPDEPEYQHKNINTSINPTELERGEPSEAFATPAVPSPDLNELAKLLEPTFAFADGSSGFTHVTYIHQAPADVVESANGLNKASEYDEADRAKGSPIHEGIPKIWAEDAPSMQRELFHDASLDDGVNVKEVGSRSTVSSPKELYNRIQKQLQRKTST